jgi:nicotinamide riboside kinase
MKIAVFGTHAAAKTTLVYKLASFFKMLNKNVTVIHEVARQSPFPINTDVVYQTILYIVASQLQQELEAEAQGFEIVISDRTLSDAFIYLNHVERDNVLTHSLQSFCMDWILQYDVLIYLEPSEGFSISDDGVRAVDVNYQRAIQDDFCVLVEEIEQKHLGKVPIVKAESSQVFDEQEFRKLTQEIQDRMSIRFGVKEKMAPI